MANPTGLYGPATRVPAIPDTRTAKPEDVANAMKEWIEVREGVRGDGMDKAVTVRDLLNFGLAELSASGGLGAPQVGEVPGSSDTSPAIPPTPVNLEASGTLKYIILTWDFARGYSRLAYFEVWRGVTDVLGDAVMVAQPFGTIYADDVGPGKTYFYWVRAVSDAPASSPYSSLAGTKGETTLDSSYVIGLLQGQISESELNDELGGRISLVDGPATQPGSVAARIAAQTNTLMTVIDGYTAAIQTNASSIDGLKLQYTLKLDNNGYVSGYGLASTPVNGVPFSTMIVRADSFSIGSPSGPGIPPAIPFIVRTTVSVINGVTVPIGVYIADAFIGNGTIANAKIGNLQVDDAKIANVSVAKLRAGAISVSEYIESSNYASGSVGWRIHGNGDAEFRNGIFRGTVYATAGLIGGNVIADDSLANEKIKTGAINARTLAADAITASTIQVQGSSDNILIDPKFRDLVWWGRDAGRASVGQWADAGQVSGWKDGASMFLAGSAGELSTDSRYFELVSGATYLVEGQCSLTPDFNGRLSVYFFIQGLAWYPMLNPIGQASATGSVANPSQSWSDGLPVQINNTSPRGLLTFSSVATLPVSGSVAGFVPRGMIRIRNSNTTGNCEIGGLSITRITDGGLLRVGRIGNTGEGVEIDKFGGRTYDGNNVKRHQWGNLDV